MADAKRTTKVLKFKTREQLEKERRFKEASKRIRERASKLGW